MSDVAKLGGILSVIGGLLCIVFGFGTTGSAAVPSIFLIAAGVSALISGAVLYCVGQITQAVQLCAAHLDAIRRNTERPAPPVETRAAPAQPDIGRMAGIFAERR